jgi:dTDP-glucose 4,6-dehydratase
MPTAASKQISASCSPRTEGSNGSIKNSVTPQFAKLLMALRVRIPEKTGKSEKLLSLRSTYVDTNIKGTLNVLQAARELGISKLIHTSTSEVYGSARFVPITEEHPLQGQSPYSATKIAADQLVYSFYTSFQLPVITIRPFNTYGPRQSARAVIPTIITQIASGAKVIKLGSIQTTRDFSYVDDTVAGFIAALAGENALGEVINLGSNFEISIENTAKIIAEEMKTDVTFSSDEIRHRPAKSEVERLWADNSKARKVLDWSPEYSDFDGFRRGLNKTINWFLQRDNLKLYKSNQYNI